MNKIINIGKSCQVAKSFHVKPLLNWLQGDNKFLTKENYEELQYKVHEERF